MVEGKVWASNPTPHPIKRKSSFLKGRFLFLGKGGSRDENPQGLGAARRRIPLPTPQKENRPFSRHGCHKEVFQSAARTRRIQMKTSERQGCHKEVFQSAARMRRIQMKTSEKGDFCFWNTDCAARAISHSMLYASNPRGAFFDVAALTRCWGYAPSPRNRLVSAFRINGFLPEVPAGFLVLSVGLDRKCQRARRREVLVSAFRINGFLPEIPAVFLYFLSVATESTKERAPHRDQSSLPRLIFADTRFQPRLTMPSYDTFRLCKLFDAVRVRAKIDKCTAIAAHAPDKPLPIR